jgi:hypothetical protein
VGNAAADPSPIPSPPRPRRPIPPNPSRRRPQFAPGLDRPQPIVGGNGPDWIIVRSCGSPIGRPRAASGRIALGFRRVRLLCGQALGFRHGREGLPEAAAEGVPRTLQGEASGPIQLARRRLARMALIGIGCCIDSRCLMVWFLFCRVAGAATADRGSPAAQRHTGVA